MKPSEKKASALPPVAPSVGMPPWRRLMAEALTITASILLALAVNAWWDGRKDRAEEHRALLRARDEFAVNTRLLEESRQARIRILAAADTFMKIAIEPATSGARVRVPGLVLGQVLSWHTFDPLNGNITSLIASGTLRLIRSDSLRILIASWPDLARDLNEDEDIDRAVVQEQLLPAMFGGIAPAPAYERGHRPDTELVVSWSAYNLVNRRRISCLEIIDDMNAAEAHIARIRSLIETELGR
jgi:hypothetical protein